MALRKTRKRLGAQQKLTCSASEKCPRRGTRFRNQFEIVRYYPAKKITLIPRRAARALKGGARAVVLSLCRPRPPLETAEGTKRNQRKINDGPLLVGFLLVGVEVYDDLPLSG